MERKWLVEITGQEVMENRAIVRKAGQDFKVYGTATLDFALAANVLIKKVRNKWVYGDGQIVTCKVTGHRMRYKPDHVYTVKRVFCTNLSSIARMQGRRIGGLLFREDRLTLTWPLPDTFREPAVEVVITSGGEEKQACLYSDHFMDQVSEYEIELKDGWQKAFEKKFSGSLRRARVAYLFSVKKDR